MLTADRSGHLTARCDKCGTSTPTLGTDRQRVDSELRAAGWTPMPRKGQGSEKWHWWCPACQPKRAGSVEFTTAVMPSVRATNEESASPTKGPAQE